MLLRNLIQFKSSLHINSVNNMGLAIEELSASSYDLIIIDMDSLGGKFPQFLQAKNGCNSDTIIIMLSSFPSKITFKKFFERGVNYCLDKAGEFEILLKKMEDIFVSVRNSSQYEKEYSSGTIN